MKILGKWIIDPKAFILFLKTLLHLQSMKTDKSAFTCVISKTSFENKERIELTTHVSSKEKQPRSSCGARDRDSLRGLEVRAPLSSRRGPQAPGLSYRSGAGRPAAGVRAPHGGALRWPPFPGALAGPQCSVALATPAGGGGSGGGGSEPVCCEGLGPRGGRELRMPAFQLTPR